MTRSVSTSSASATLGLLLVLLASGCGGHKKDPLASLERKQKCLFAAEFGAEMNVVRSWVSAGRITKAEIVAQFPSDLPKSDYLDDTGNVLPYTKVADPARSYYDDWRLRLEHRPGGDRLLAAQRKARNAAADRCASLS